LRQVLQRTDVFLPNELEARFISGRGDVLDAIQVFRGLGVSVNLVKQGEKGALLVSGVEKYTCTLPPVSGGDSIGAGDSFDAGFLAGWLRDLPLDDCLRIASHCGRQVAAQVGGLQGQPDWETVSELAGVG
jgi:sugar/nucleoside kinase (ribokinase family)